MSFAVGQTVVHPFHGPVRIVERTQRMLRGTPTPCLRMVTAENTLDISVPVARVEQVGLREVSSRARVDELLGILGTPATTGGLQWSRQMKEYQHRLSTGRLEDVCLVIREIARSGPHAPGTTSGQMLRTARGRLAAEIALALHVSGEDADSLIDGALRPA
ncbi:CarD family transcriptional regulator [Brachybacterium sp. DNPG3]